MTSLLASNVQPQTAGEPARQRFADYRWLGLIMAVAILLRLPGLFTDFAHDEVWTWGLIRERVHSWFEVFTEARIDNNHPLNTLFMYFIGDQRNWVFYRIPSMLAGLGTVVLAWRLGRRRGRAHGLATAAVMALSYPLVVYSTAARGYSMTTFFTFFAIDVLDQSPLADLRLWQCALFAGAVVLGCLSQPVFVIGYAAMVIWSACDIVWENQRSASLRGFACCHAIPIIVIAIYGFGFVLRLTIGGNPPTSLSALLADGLTFTTGLGSGMSSDRITPIVAGLMCIAATVIVGRAWPRLLTLLIPAFILLPAASLGFVRYVQHPDLAPWYFISSMSMMLFAIGLAFGEICRSGSRPLHACGLAIFLAFAGANMLQTYRFSTIGRGHYLAALQYMAANSEGGELELGSDQDSRTLKMLAFYARYLPNGPSIRYVQVTNSASAKPKWFVLNVLLPAEIRPTIVLRGTKYTLAQTFPYYAPMGLCWTVYRRVGD